jgi:hypothetical protein
MRSAVLFISILLSFASIGWAGQSVTPGGVLFAYDAQGKKVGRVVDVNSSVVSLRVGATTTRATVFADGLRVDNGGYPYFESSDCTGPAFIPVLPDNLWSRLFATGGTTVYGSQPNAAAQTITVGSAQPGPCETAAQIGPPSQIQAFPAVPVVDLSTVFTPPFSIH